MASKTFQPLAIPMGHWLPAIPSLLPRFPVTSVVRLLNGKAAAICQPKGEGGEGWSKKHQEKMGEIEEFDVNK